jgi:hypothetical protein
MKRCVGFAWLAWIVPIFRFATHSYDVQLTYLDRNILAKAGPANESLAPQPARREGTASAGNVRQFDPVAAAAPDPDGIGIPLAFKPARSSARSPLTIAKPSEAGPFSTVVIPQAQRFRALCIVIPATIGLCP